MGSAHTAPPPGSRRPVPACTLLQRRGEAPARGCQDDAVAGERPAIGAHERDVGQQGVVEESLGAGLQQPRQVQSAGRQLREAGGPAGGVCVGAGGTGGGQPGEVCMWRGVGGGALTRSVSGVRLKLRTQGVRMT